jgi:hypothetical protein
VLSERALKATSCPKTLLQIVVTKDRPCGPAGHYNHNRLAAALPSNNASLGYFADESAFP